MKKIMVFFIISICTLQQPLCWAMGGEEEELEEGFEILEPSEDPETISQEPETARTWWDYISSIMPSEESKAAVSESVTQTITDVARFVSKQVSSDLYRQMVGADRRNSTEFKKTKAIYDAITSLGDTEEMDEKLQKQLLERIGYANLIALNYSNLLIQYINAPEPKEQNFQAIFFAAEEGKNLLKFDEQYDLSLTPWIKKRLREAIDLAVLHKLPWFWD